MKKTRSNFSIGNVSLANNVLAAPMAGVTDTTFRILLRKMGCGLTYSEMVSAKGLFYHSANTHKLLETHPEERPSAVQIFGSDPKIMAEMTEKLPHDIIDINMGCPAPKIVKNGEGSALMKNIPLLGEIVHAVSQSTDKPVTIKIRKGFLEENAVEAAIVAEKNGASAITVHGRTREEYYSGQADWHIIRKVKEAVCIPVIGNGDITSGPKAQEMLQQTGCDAIMIGRACQGNPWIFREVIHYLETGEILPPPTKQERIDLALFHARHIVEDKGEHTGIREMRKHMAWYTKGMAGGANIRKQINAVVTLAELEELLLTTYVLNTQ